VSTPSIGDIAASISIGARRVWDLSREMRRSHLLGDERSCAETRERQGTVGGERVGAMQ
jgi:hypothetical protein